MRTERRLFGDRAEALAARYFLDRGFTVLDQQWTCREGELDLVLQRGNHLHFIEVKARGAIQTQHPFESIDVKKRQRIACAIERWQKAHPWYAHLTYQVDAFCVWREEGNWKQEWIEGM